MNNNMEESERLRQDVYNEATLYKTLLTKYVDHVVQCEGEAFISYCVRYSDVVFTDQELHILKRIENRLYPD